MASTGFVRFAHGSEHLARERRGLADAHGTCHIGAIATLARAEIHDHHVARLQTALARNAMRGGAIRAARDDRIERQALGHQGGAWFLRARASPQARSCLRS